MTSKAFLPQKSSGESATSSRISSRTHKKKLFYDDFDSSSGAKKTVRQCERSGCPAVIPICFASATERCAGSGYTSRWYHISPGEHFCNECFEYYYRSHKDGYEIFAKWKREWSALAKTEASVRMYMADQMLPFWVQCTRCECQKWRQLSRDVVPTPQFQCQYTCGMNSSGGKKENQAEACAAPEDYRVELSQDLTWLSHLHATVGLCNSPAALFLKDFVAETVGLCPTSIPHASSDPDEESEQNFFCQPFCLTEDSEVAFSVKPNFMSEEEKHEFFELTKDPSFFLGLRNLVIALWNLNVKEWLTWRRCAAHVIHRGVTRIKSVCTLKHIVAFLTRKGYINVGLLKIPSDSNHFSYLLPAQDSIIVIGAGASGLAAAKQLINFGATVTLLEAQDRLGGRVQDENSMGMCVGYGGQIINGCINNPLCLMCLQAGIEMKVINDRCQLLDAHGRLVDDDKYRRMHFHFNALLDVITEWRKDANISHDTDLLSKFIEVHDQFLDESQLTFTQEEDNLLQYFVGNLEYMCGCSLDKLSALSWDQNEMFPQFGNSRILIVQGYSHVLQLLAEDLDIRYNMEVTEINYSDMDITVSTSSGNKFKASKVLVTVPLTVLQRDSIKFIPTLPEKKTQAIRSLSIGVIEKIVLRFEENFWTECVKNANYFGCIPVDGHFRGLFGAFYDISCTLESGETLHVLMSHLAGSGLKMVNNKSDKKTVALCLQVLRKMFPKQNVPKPIQYFVTHWQDDKFSGMAYSYVPVGVDGTAYDKMAEDVNEKLFFAGEATCRQFPGSVTGAYWSGIREAEKIILSLSDTE